jgi:2-polyprenyl-3-methyl-5-hydroxy-6-metoxy-1,4-benzoquinol methylase
MFNFLNECLKYPKIYTPSESNFWNDEYISKKLLEIHLNPDIELGSRKPDFIEKSVNWIGETISPTIYPKLLDVGCGPGIYSERFARIGYEVTGIDFSKRSIEYARNIAKELCLPITYLYQNYLELKLEESYDFATMIYCDYGALSNENRKLLMSKVYDRLKPGGKFLLDICSIKQYVDTDENQTWEIQEQDGFWSPEKYLCFNAYRKYPDYTTLCQAVVVTQNETKIYYIWNHCFTKDSLIEEATEAGFHPIQIYSDVAGNPYTDSSMTIAILLEK